PETLSITESPTSRATAGELTRRAVASPGEVGPSLHESMPASASSASKTGARIRIVIPLVTMVSPGSADLCSAHSALLRHTRAEPLPPHRSGRQESPPTGLYSRVRLDLHTGAADEPSQRSDTTPEIRNRRYPAPCCARAPALPHAPGRLPVRLHPMLPAPAAHRCSAHAPARTPPGAGSPRKPHPRPVASRPGAAACKAPRQTLEQAPAAPPAEPGGLPPPRIAWCSCQSRLPGSRHRRHRPQKPEAGWYPRTRLPGSAPPQ